MRRSTAEPNGLIRADWMIELWFIALYVAAHIFSGAGGDEGQIGAIANVCQRHPFA